MFGKIFCDLEKKSSYEVESLLHLLKFGENFKINFTVAFLARLDLKFYVKCLVINL